MALFLITMVLLAGIAGTFCGIIPQVVAPTITYTRIAPPNIPPFAASVNTFTKGLNIFQAPYAAGILPISAGYPYATPNFPLNGVPLAALLPGNLPPSFGLSPPLIPGSYAARPAIPGILSPGAAPPLAVAPSALLPAPFGVEGRSIHQVSPGIVSGGPPLIAHATLR